MTTTPHGQVPEALIDLIDAYAETRHRCGGIYNARTEAARKAVIEALSGVQALSAAPAAAAGPSLQHLHDLLYTAQRTTGDAQAQAIAEARIALSGIMTAQEPAVLASRAWPKVSGVSRDEGHSRALLVFFAAEPADDEMRAVHDTLAAAPTAKAAPQQEAQPTEIPQVIERMATDRYKVVPSHESMFHRWAVVAGSGTQQLYLGREVECQNMARKFAGAFLDGAFFAMQQPAPKQEAQEPVAWQSRTRPTWGGNTRPWSPWVPCTKEHAEDCWKTPLLNDWAYEARALYTAPQPAPAPLDAVDHYLEAQDALDNREYGGINAEPYEKLLRRRNASRNDLDAALAAQRGNK